MPRGFSYHCFVGETCGSLGMMVAKVHRRDKTEMMLRMVATNPVTLAPGAIFMNNGLLSDMVVPNSSDFEDLWEEVFGRHESRYSGLSSIPSLRDEIYSLRMEINQLRTDLILMKLEAKQ
jgi:hypothetical protein